MATVQFYPIDLTYKVIKGKAHIYLYGRTQDGKQICVVDDTTEPYFYIVPNDVDFNAITQKLKDLEIEKRGIEPEIIRTGMETSLATRKRS